MLYKSSDFKKISQESLLCANLDIISDCVPLMSTVTNVARVVFKVCFTAMWLVSTGIIAVGYTIKAITIALSVDKDKHLYVGLCFYHFMQTCFVIQSLWMKTFLSHHFLKKSYFESFLHAVPVIGNIMAYKSTDLRSYDQLVKECETQLKQWIITPKVEQHTPLFSYYYPILIPEYLKDNKKLIVADCQLNPYHIKNIPQSYFQDNDFVKQLLRVLTYYHHGQYSYIADADFVALMELIITKAQQYQLMKTVTLPFANYLALHARGQFLALINQYPDLLWLLEDKTGGLTREEKRNCIKTCPHMITIMNEEFLKANSKLVKGALRQDPFIASKISHTILKLAFNSQEDVLRDPLFLACDKHNPGLKLAMMAHLEKKKANKKSI